MTDLVVPPVEGDPSDATAEAPPVTTGGASATRLERAIAVVAAALLALGSVAVARSGPVDQPDVSGVGAPSPEAQDDAQIAAGRQAAGCVLLVDGVPLPDRTHLDPSDAPPAEALYPRNRPANSGRHFGSVLRPSDRVATEPLDERVVLHNMEHGSVVVWFDTDAVDAGTTQDLQEWLAQRRALGFESKAAGGIFVSPFAAITSGRAIAIRAWGFALDCDRFDTAVADGFLQEHWGSRGASPEAHLSPFPLGVMGEIGSSV